MTSQTHFIHPPRIATWLLDLFVPPQEAESILGDLLEEFSDVASRSGERSARRWYWRQTIKTVPRLAGSAVRTAPWLTSSAVAGGFLLRKLTAPLVGRAIFDVLERYQNYFEYHFAAYIFFASTGIDICHLIALLLIGFVVAQVARRNEVTATLALALIYGAMAVAGTAYVVNKTGSVEPLWRLRWYFADSFAIVVSGVLVRMHRLAAASRQPSKA